MLTTPRLRAQTTFRPACRAFALLTGLGIALLVAGCGETGSRTPTTVAAPQTTTATPTPSPTPSPTPEPEPEHEPTSTVPTSRAESSWAVVEEFFDAYTYGIQTGESKRLRELSTENCKTCANFIKTIDGLKARQVIGTGGELTFPYSEGMRTPYPERDVWYIQYRESKIERTLKNPTETVHVDETDGEMFVELTESVDGWRVSKISAEAERGDK